MKKPPFHVREVRELTYRFVSKTLHLGPLRREIQTHVQQAHEANVAWSVTAHIQMQLLAPIVLRQICLIGHGFQIHGAALDDLEISLDQAEDLNGMATYSPHRDTLFAAKRHISVWIGRSGGGSHSTGWMTALEPFTAILIGTAEQPLETLTKVSWKLGNGDYQVLEDPVVETRTPSPAKTKRTPDTTAWIVKPSRGRRT